MNPHSLVLCNVRLTNIPNKQMSLDSKLIFFFCLIGEEYNLYSGGMTKIAMIINYE